MKCPLKCRLAEKEICNIFISEFGGEKVILRLGCNMREDLSLSSTDLEKANEIMSEAQKIRGKTE